jgi:hypothetical protein
MTTTATGTQTVHTCRRSARARRFATTGAATAAAAMLVPIASASADPPPLPRQTHCAAAYALTPVSDFANTVYESFVTGLDLNGNGYVCVRQAPDAASTALDPHFGLPAGSPIYLVGDDSIAITP